MTKTAVILVSVLTKLFDFVEGCSDTFNRSAASHKYSFYNFRAGNYR